MREYKFGKTPARPGSVQFKMSEFFDLGHLPNPPLMFGLGKNYTWEMLANDRVGDCVFAGQAHLEQLWHTQFNRPIDFSDESVISDYSAVTGYNPNDPNTDNGTDMETAAKYWRKNGIVDAEGKRHQIDAYVSIPKWRFDQIATAAWLFDGVGLGIMVPDSAMKQFEQQIPWSVVPGSPVRGGIEGG